METRAEEQRLLIAEHTSGPSQASRDEESLDIMKTKLDADRDLINGSPLKEMWVKLDGYFLRRACEILIALRTWVWWGLIAFESMDLGLWKLWGY
ncbi:hypothetical protein IFR05_005105 [Cadophora sp. M221]|nr:hypothetical protein IFR05_005105 [Cadophora sp. M221]